MADSCWVQLRWKRDEDRKQKQQTVRTVKLTACNLFLAAAGLSRVLEVIAVVGVSAVNICHPNRLVTTSDSLLIKGTHAAPPQP